MPTSRNQLLIINLIKSITIDIVTSFELFGTKIHFCNSPVQIEIHENLMINDKENTEQLTIIDIHS